jgi:carbamoyltransferase
VLADGFIVGLFQGPMEFGPRALGFRSILADPRNIEMKERINKAVKYREAFRPFAPAVLEEKASDYFDCDRPSPYMLFNFPVSEDRRESIPAVTHVDGSSRIQTVNRADNAVLYDILKAFESKTGVPVVLNTSFNLRGHPIVNTPRQALATFCSSGIDLLALESYFISKKDLSNEILVRFRIAHKPD